MDLGPIYLGGQTSALDKVLAQFLEGQSEFLQFDPAPAKLESELGGELDVGRALGRTPLVHFGAHRRMLSTPTAIYTYVRAFTSPQTLSSQKCRSRLACWLFTHPCSLAWRGGKKMKNNQCTRVFSRVWAPLCSPFLTQRFCSLL